MVVGGLFGALGDLELFLSPGAGLESPFGPLGARIGSCQSFMSVATTLNFGVSPYFKPNRAP